MPKNKNSLQPGPNVARLADPDGPTRFLPITLIDIDLTYRGYVESANAWMQIMPGQDPWLLAHDLMNAPRGAIEIDGATDTFQFIVSTGNVDQDISGVSSLDLHMTCTGMKPLSVLREYEREYMVSRVPPVDSGGWVVETFSKESEVSKVVMIARQLNELHAEAIRRGGVPK